MNIKRFLFWIYNNILLRYWQFRYHTTLMTLARLTLLVLAKGVMVPLIYIVAVCMNIFCQADWVLALRNALEVIYIPSWTEVIVAALAVFVFLTVAFVQYRMEINNKRMNDDLFVNVYIPYVDRIMELLDAENYREWVYYLAVDGNTVIWERQLDNLEELSRYCMNRVRHKEFAELDTLIYSLGLLETDFVRYFNSYCELHGGQCMITRFYKSCYPNPLYKEDLNRYNEIVFLCSDLMFEQTRICNKILDIVRMQKPDYKTSVGILTVDGAVEHGQYREDEWETSPYTGIDDFREIRKKRNHFYG